MLKKAIHGEVIFKECKIPQGARRIEVKNNFFIVGESETHGNDHRVAVKEGVELYEYQGTLYIKNIVDTEIYCPNETRHDTKTLPSSEWEVGHALEFDYLDDKERIVRD